TSSAMFVMLPTPLLSPLSLPDALPIYPAAEPHSQPVPSGHSAVADRGGADRCRRAGARPRHGGLRVGARLRSPLRREPRPADHRQVTHRCAALLLPPRIRGQSRRAQAAAEVSRRLPPERSRPHIHLTPSTSNSLIRWAIISVSSSVGMSRS